MNSIDATGAIRVTENTVLRDFAMLASDTARTKAYIQMMVREGLFPAKCIVYTDDEKKMEDEAEKYEGVDVSAEYFNLDEPVLWTIKQAGIGYEIIDNKDINSDEMKDVVQSLPQKYLIYSGYGGYILKPHLFQMGKKFVHIHAGILPMYRGSTTAYYSILQENYIGATAIFLSEGIDEGEIITSEMFDRPSKNVNIDVLYEPYLRSQVLKKALLMYKKDTLSGRPQETKDAQTYFIIHPVLKHLALMAK